MNYTLQIIKEGAAAAGDFDGTTPLDLDTATITTNEAGRIIVTIASGTDMGSFDPGEVLERAKTPSGITYWAMDFLIDTTSSFNSGDVIRRRAPGAPGNQTETLINLQTSEGLPVDSRFLVQAKHTIEVLTTNGGQHGLQVLMKPVKDEDFRHATVE